MVVGVAIAELHIHQARGLKEKRSVVKSLVERLHARLRVSASETDFHDLHQRAELGIALVARDDQEAERLLESIREMVEGGHAYFVARFDTQLVDIRS